MENRYSYDPDWVGEERSRCGSASNTYGWTCRPSRATRTCGPDGTSGTDRPDGSPRTQGYCRTVRAGWTRRSYRCTGTHRSHGKYGTTRTRRTCRPNWADRPTRTKRRPAKRDLRARDARSKQPERRRESDGLLRNERATCYTGRHGRRIQRHLAEYVTVELVQSKWGHGSTRK